MKSATSLRCAIVCACSTLLLLSHESQARQRSRHRPARSHSDHIAAGAPGVLRRGPGDSFKVLGSVAAGTAIEILGVKGRWARVRSGRWRGWILRRRLRGYVGKLAKGPSVDKRADRVWSGLASTPQFRVSVRRSHVELHSAPDSAPWRPTTLPRREFNARLRLGYRALSMDFRSDGQGILANTLVQAQTANLDAEFEFVARSADRRRYLAAEGRLRIGDASPGIAVIREGMSVGEIPFRIYGSRAGLRAGLVLGDFEIAARGGVRYEIFSPATESNPGTLSREALLGAVAGLQIDWYRFAPKLVLSLLAESMVAGSLAQSSGLQDGERAAVQGIWSEVRARYQLSASTDLIGSYQYGWTNYEWSGMSARNPDATASFRTDTSQNFALGVARRF